MQRQRTAALKSPGKDATNLGELVNNDVQTVPLHVQGLGLVSCLQNLQQKQRQGFPSALLRRAVHKYCSDSQEITPLSYRTINVFHYKPESFLN